MFEGIKGIVGSKKFWITIVGSAVVVALQMLHMSPEIIAIVSGLFGLNALGQGMADFGKEKAKVESKE